MYSVIVADPPWKHSAQGGKRGASAHYSLMTNEDIFSFLEDEKIPVADNAVLFLWRVASMPEEALQTCKEWGFTPKTEIVWVKQTKHGKIHFGMGSYVRGSHETCLIGIRGSHRPKIRNVRSIFMAPVGRHSEKPAMFFSIIERMYDGPYLELFSRKRREGWDCIGDEVDVEVEGRTDRGGQGDDRHVGGLAAVGGGRPRCLRYPKANNGEALYQTPRQDSGSRYSRRRWSVR